MELWKRFQIFRFSKLLPLHLKATKLKAYKWWSERKFAGTIHLLVLLVYIFGLGSGFYLGISNFQTNVAAAEPGETVWAKSVESGTSTSGFSGTTTDKDGNVYGFGTINRNGIFSFGDGVTAQGGFVTGGNAVLVKYSPTGPALWAKTVTAGAAASRFYDAVTDSAGNVFAAGYITGTGNYDFGSGVIVSGVFSGKNTIVVKYDPDGNALWGRSTYIASGISELLSVASDTSGNIYAAGSIDTTSAYDFGNSVTVSGSHTVKNVLLIKYDNDGSALWAKSVTTGGSNSSFTGITTTSTGFLYLTGTLFGTGSFDFGNSVTLAGLYSGNNGFVIRYDADGTPLWARAAEVSPNSALMSDVSSDTDDNLYIAGTITGTDTYSFGNSVTAAAPNASTNAMIIKYDPNGVAQWAKTTLSSPASTVFNSIGVDSGGNVYTVGNISGNGTVNFGNNITVNGSHTSLNIIFVGYDSDGLPFLAKTMAVGAANSYFSGVSVDDTGNIFAGGTLAASISYDFGNSVTVTPGYAGSNAMIVSYLGVPAEPPIIDNTPPAFVGFDFEETVDGVKTSYSGYLNLSPNRRFIKNLFQVKTKPIDESGILKVDFYVDDVLKATDTTADDGFYAGDIDLNTVTNKEGGVVVKAVATDTVNNTSEVSVTILPDPWFYPYNGTTKVDIYPPVFSTVTLTEKGTGDNVLFVVTGIDNAGSTRVDFSMDNYHASISPASSTVIPASLKTLTSFRTYVTLPANKTSVTFNLRVYDGAGLFADRTETYTLTDNDAPGISKLSPTAGTTGDTFNIAITATDNISTPSLSAFVNDSVNSLTVTDGKFDLLVPENSLEPLKIKIKAVDAVGNIKETLFDFPVTDNDAPIIDKFTPPAEITPTENKVTVSATDNIGVVRAAISLDGLIYNDMVGTTSPFTYDVDTSALKTGSKLNYTIRVYDAAGNFVSTDEASSTVLKPPLEEKKATFLENILGQAKDVLVQVNGMTTDVIKQTPPPVAHTFPYLLFAVLGFFAWRLASYARQEALQSGKVLDIVRFQKVVAEDKENFIALSSHYLRTPLTIIKGGFDITVAPDAVKEKISNAIAAMEAEVKRILNLIENNRYLSKINKPDIKKAKVKAYTSLMIWLPIILIAGLVILANYLFINLQVIEPETINLMFQGIVFVIVAQFFFSVYRKKFTEKQNLENLEKTMKYEQQMDKARDEFIDEITNNLIERLNKVTAATKGVKGPSESVFTEGEERFKAVLPKLALLKEVKSGTKAKDKMAISASLLINSILKSKEKEIKAKNLTITRSGTLGSIHQNPELFAFILDTVVDNAIKFSKENSKVTIECIGTKGLAKFIVTDSGAGISKEGMMHLFKPFTRATSAMHFNYEGVGISLYLSKIISEYMGGDIQIDSKPGKGTKVTVIIQM